MAFTGAKDVSISSTEFCLLIGSVPVSKPAAAPDLLPPAAGADSGTHPLLRQRRNHVERVGQDQVRPEELELAVSPPHGLGRLHAALSSGIRGPAARAGLLESAVTRAHAPSRQKRSPGLDQVHRERLLHADGVLPAPLLGLGHADLHPAQQVRVPPLHLKAASTFTPAPATTGNPRHMTETVHIRRFTVKLALPSADSPSDAAASSFPFSAIIPVPAAPRTRRYGNPASLRQKIKNMDRPTADG